MKKQISFVDGNSNKVTVNIEIKDGRFSIIGDMGSGLGQIVDSISPRTEYQEVLVDLWNKYHLNDMKPGTPKQMEFLKTCGYKLNTFLENGHKSRYDFEKWLLDREGILTDTSYDGTPITYGHQWLTEELPEDIEEIVEECLEMIEEEEQERRGDTLLSSLEYEEIIELIKEEHPHEDEDVIYAIVEMFELTANELNDIDIESDNRICVQGVDYLFGTDDEMDKHWDEGLDNYLEDCVYPEISGTLKQYFDDEAWKSDAKMDGRAHVLNMYDGSEDYVTIKDVTYYAYRQ